MAEISEEDLLKQSEKDAKKEERESERLKARLYEIERQNKVLQEQLEKAKEEKRKPGLTVVEEDGTQNRRKRPNTWGLTDLMMPPYTKGRVAIYKAIGIDGKNPATGLDVEPFPVLIPGRCTIYDKFEDDPLKRDKVIENVVGTESYEENGKIKRRNVIEDVVMDRGFLQVFVEKEYPLFCFMERHNMNISNPHRIHGSVAGFERVDINIKAPTSQGAALDLAITAGMEIKNMNKEDVLSYAAMVKEISTAAGRPVHEIRTDLQRWAMNNPIGYYKINKNAKAAIQINILDAINFGLVEYKIDRKGYVYVETEEVICSHTPAQEPMEELVKFLAKPEGKEWYGIILDRMNYWKND